MSNIVQGWSYTQEMDQSRFLRLLEVSDFNDVIEMIARSSVDEFLWEAFGKAKLRGCHRASFRLKVSCETYDAFFNSPIGYRGQYALSPKNGERSNRALINRIRSNLLDYVPEQGQPPKSLVEASLNGIEAKIWIDECESSSQIGGNDPAILYGPWQRSPEHEQGVPAPIGTLLEVKGGWLNGEGVEQLNPYKENRSHEIHSNGYT